MAGVACVTRAFKLQHRVLHLPFSVQLAFKAVSCHIACAFKMADNAHFAFCTSRLFYVLFFAINFPLSSSGSCLAVGAILFSEIGIVQCSTYGLGSIMTCTYVVRGFDLVSYRSCCKLRSLELELTCINKINLVSSVTSTYILLLPSLTSYK